VATPAAASNGAGAAKKGLILAHDFHERSAIAAEKARADLERISALGGDAAPETVLRDKSGKRISVAAYEQQLADERAKKEHKPMEWASGLAQKKQAEEAAARFVAEAARPFARTADDAELNASQREADRWGDPMLLALRRAEAKAKKDELALAQEAQEKVLRREQRRAKKEIKREKKELKRDKKKLRKQLEKQRIIDVATGTVAADAPLIDAEQQERLVAELLGEKKAALAAKKDALRKQQSDVESRIALDLAAGGSNIVVPAAQLAGTAAAAAAVTREARPLYRGTSFPNRWGIRSGYRWDGVIRGIGWEDRIARVANQRAHAKSRGYKMSSEDM